MKNKIHATIILYILISISIPVIFKYTIFENLALSNLSNSEWAGFLGSYAGGILGGLGTLIAVYITVKSSISIQEENQKETDRRIQEECKRHNDEIIDENRRRAAERVSDIEVAQKRDRKLFADNIAKELGRYITHISNYHYESLKAENLQKELSIAKENLVQIEKELRNVGIELSKVNWDNPDEIVKISAKRDVIADEKDRLSRIYNEILAEQRVNSEFGNRLVANETFFTLKVALCNIKFADDFLKKLEEIHRGSGLVHAEEKFYGQWITTETAQLMQEFSVFAEKYIENAEN